MGTRWTGPHEDHSACERGRHINVGRRQVADPRRDRAALTLQGIVESLADLQSLVADAEPSTRHQIVQTLRQTGRGERDSPSRTQRPGPLLLINRTGGRALGKESS